VRRRPFPRGFLGRGKRKPPVNWVSEYWKTSISLNNLDSNSFALCVINDIDASSSIVQIHYQLRRVVVELAVELAPRTVSEDLVGPEAFCIPWMLGIADAEDQDRDEIRQSGLGTWLQSSRILQCGIQAYTFRQAVSGAAGFHNGEFHALPNISIDWKGRANMKPDDELWLVLMTDGRNFPGDNGFYDSNIFADVAGFSRVLIQKKGA